MFPKFLKNTKGVKKSKGKAENQLYAAIDIGTEFVKTAVYRVVDKEIEVVGYNRTKQRETTMYAAFIMNIEEATETIDKSIGEAILMAKEHMGEDFLMPTEAIIGIAGELVQGVTVVVNLDRDNPKAPITHKEIATIVDRLKKQTFENTKEEIALEVGMKAAHLEEIDTFVNSVSVDGVRVINPIGYVGSEIVYRMFSTFAPKVHLNALKQLAANLNLNVRKIVVEPYALSIALKGSRESSSSNILVDIGGGTTDVAVVQNGDIMGTKMFAIGGRVFTKSIQKQMGVTYEEAEERKLLYSEGKLDKKLRAEVATILNKNVNIWLQGMEIALKDFEDVNEFPPKISICGGGTLLPEIQEGLISYPWQQFLNFPKHPKVDFVFPNHITNLTDKTRSATLPMDVTPLALARMHLEA